MGPLDKLGPPGPWRSLVTSKIRRLPPDATHGTSYTTPALLYATHHTPCQTTGSHAPLTGHQPNRTLHTKHQAPSTQHQAPSTKHQAPSTKHKALGTARLSWAELCRAGPPPRGPLDRLGPSGPRHSFLTVTTHAIHHTPGTAHQSPQAAGFGACRRLGSAELCRAGPLWARLTTSASSAPATL